MSRSDLNCKWLVFVKVDEYLLGEEEVESTEYCYGICGMAVVEE